MTAHRMRERNRHEIQQGIDEYYARREARYVTVQPLSAAELKRVQPSLIDS